MPKKKIRVLIVDDSPIVLSVLEQGLSADPGIDVVGTASDVYEARDKLVELAPDVMTLDIRMPRMNGIEFLRRIMPQYPLPVVVISSVAPAGGNTVLEALEAGAVDFVSKPSGLEAGNRAWFLELATKIKIASTANVGSAKARSVPDAGLQTFEPIPDSGHRVIAIGASTGGTNAILAVLRTLPVYVPGIVIVQHMPAGFTKAFAERLDHACAIRVKEAVSGDRIVQGQALIAPGGLHMRISGVAGQFSVICREGDKVNGHCPSVDVLFHSVAAVAGRRGLGIILTGMGSDGAAGLLAMRKAGCMTVAQDERSCVVFGMPKAAFDQGGVISLLPLDRIGPSILQYLSTQSTPVKTVR